MLLGFVATFVINVTNCFTTAIHTHPNGELEIKAIDY